jgi:hypothetical protein
MRRPPSADAGGGFFATHGALRGPKGQIPERRNGSRWRPTGPPLPRPLSPTEREKGENSIPLRMGPDCVREVPLPRPLPVRSSRRGENSILLRKTLVTSIHPKHTGDSVRVTSLPRCLRGRGRERGPPSDAVRTHSSHLHPIGNQPPPAVWGRSRGTSGWGRPGGGSSMPFATLVTRPPPFPDPRAARRLRTPADGMDGPRRAEEHA